MKIAIIGSRALTVDNLCDFIPEGVTEIVTGGARGIDKCAEKYARENNIKLAVFLPEYDRYKKAAPIIRNNRITKEEMLAPSPLLSYSFSVSIISRAKSAITSPSKESTMVALK